MDTEADALERFGAALRRAFGARLDGVHELDRERMEILVAVVVVGPLAGDDDLRAADIAYDVVPATGIAITPNVVSQSVWLSTMQNWFAAVEARRLAVLRDYFEECAEHGVGIDHSVRVLMQEWATQIRYTRENERLPEPPRDMEEWRWRHAVTIRTMRSARRHGVRLSNRIAAALKAWARTKPEESNGR